MFENVRARVDNESEDHCRDACLYHADDGVVDPHADHSGDKREGSGDRQLDRGAEGRDKAGEPGSARGGGVDVPGD